MCGIAGLIANYPDCFPDLDSCAARMGAAIAHRGPDTSGIWTDPLLGIAFAHQRLAVIDLSPAGSQPMHSSSRRYVIIFNGEIYNHLLLRRELESTASPPSWRGHSDTETLLAAIEAWGLEATLQRCTGMWALALADRRDGCVYLARDRFGEKPLYWGLTGHGQHRALVFGSELSSIRAYPAFNNPIDRLALAQFLSYGYVPAPQSIYTGISKLLPGHCVSIKLPSDLDSHLPSSRPWWKLCDVIQAGYTDPYSSEFEALEILEQALINSTSDQAISDVPIGAFLSGGIDSSLVSALLQSRSTKPLRTFTVGFEEDGFNEVPHARAVAAHLGTDHDEAFLTSLDAIGLIPNLPSLYSEPFADASQLPTHLVCRQAKLAGLTVALTGDGGDELFGGYNRYSRAPRSWNLFAATPRPLRRALGEAISIAPSSLWDIFGGKLTCLGQKVNNLSVRLRLVSTEDEFYQSLARVWIDQSTLLRFCVDSNSLAESSSNYFLPACLCDDPVARMMASDALDYLPNDILVKVDRASMAVGLEIRAPLLDHRVAAAAWRLPMSMKIRAGSSKWALRQILYKYVPRELIERPKAGFSVPIALWLRGPLRPWAEQLLHPERLQTEGYLRPEPVDLLWKQHASGRYDHSSKLWTLLMWQAWLEQWG